MVGEHAADRQALAHSRWRSRTVRTRDTRCCDKFDKTKGRGGILRPGHSAVVPEHAKSSVRIEKQSTLYRYQEEYRFHYQFRRSGLTTASIQSAGMSTKGNNRASLPTSHPLQRLASPSPTVSSLIHVSPMTLDHVQRSLN